MSIEIVLDENDNLVYPKVVLSRPPVNKDELWQVVKTLWGVEIPRVKVCADHCAPFDAFAEGYFGNTNNWVLWYGSRGTGKSLMLALLALTKAAVLEINVSLLGGSMAQSQNVQEHIENLLLFPSAPIWAVEQQIQTQITFTGGNWIRPLPASQKTVRGPHPQMTCVAGWTLVNSLDGDIPINEITVGQRIWVSDDLATPRIGVVQRVLDQGWKETINVHGDNGVITCTADHKLHTTRGWIEAGDLQPNDVLTVWQPSDWAQLKQNRTLPEVLADIWTRREIHLRLRKNEVHTIRKNVPGLLYGVEENQSTQMSGLWMSTATNLNIKVPQLPPGLDDNFGSAGKVCAGTGNRKGRNSYQQSRGGSEDSTNSSRYCVSESNSSRSMDNRFLATTVQLMDRDSWPLLARPSKESNAGQVEVSNVGSGGIFSAVPTHGREGILVGGIVRRIEHGPYCHVYDITTDAGNFYANGVLIHNCLDEIDEMDIKVYNAAMGQAMKKPNARGIAIDEMVVASSTWQNPTGTFQTVRDDAIRKGLPVRTWCFQEVVETVSNPTGWMDPDFIVRKQASVPAEMFRVEYELGEPAGGSRAFDLVALNNTFKDMPIVRERHAGSDDEWVFEEPVTTGWYSMGADWAKEEDKTVIVVFRIDESKRRCVYLRRINRRPWPEMVKMFNDIMKLYQAVAAHDATGIGNVVNDLIDERVIKFTMNGAKRGAMLMDYISAVEQLRYELPANTPAFLAHKAATQEDVYGGGGWKAHLPDDVAAFALCHYAAEHGAPVAAAAGVKKTEFRPMITREVDPEPTIREAGEVRRSDDYWNPYLV